MPDKEQRNKFGDLIKKVSRDEKSNDSKSAGEKDQKDQVRTKT